MKTVFLIIGGVIAIAVALFYAGKMFKLKKINFRFPGTMLNLLCILFVLEVVWLYDDFSVLQGWFFADVVVAVLMWFIYTGSKHFRKRKK